jgi:hypothetical protein
MAGQVRAPYKQYQNLISYCITTVHFIEPSDLRPIILSSGQCSRSGYAHLHTRVTRALPIQRVRRVIVTIVRRCVRFIT